MVGDKEDIPDDSVALLESVRVVSGSAIVSDDGKFVLRSVEYVKEEADKVGSSNGVGAAETLKSFRNLILERSVTVSSWRTLNLSSNFVMPLFSEWRKVMRRSASVNALLEHSLTHLFLDINNLNFKKANILDKFN